MDGGKGATRGTREDLVSEWILKRQVTDDRVTRVKKIWERNFLLPTIANRRLFDALVTLPSLTNGVSKFVDLFGNQKNSSVKIKSSHS